MSRGSIPENPPKYVPSPSRHPLLLQLAWPLSPAGRVLHRLRQAERRPDDPTRIAALEGALDRFRASQEATKVECSRSDRGEGTSAPSNGFLAVSESLVFLTWVNLTHGKTQEAARRLGELDFSFPELTARQSLRHDLLNRLLDEKELSDYLAQAKLLLADPISAQEDRLPDLQQVVAVVYERLGYEPCASLLRSSTEELAKHRFLAAARTLCHCPRVFNSTADGRAWLQVVPEDLTFCAIMRADAYIFRCRASEWQGDSAAMAANAQRALDSAPRHAPARYWLSRAELYSPSREGRGEDPDSQTNDAADQGPEWTRLWRMRELQARPDLRQARLAIRVLAGGHGAPDPFERNLLVELLKPALSAEPAWEASRLVECAELCTELEGFVGAQPWTQISVALKEIQVERRYDAAIERLSQPSTAAMPAATRYLRVAHIMAGRLAARSLGQSPVGSVTTESEPAAGLDALEAALSRVAGPNLGSEGDPDRYLARRLAEVPSASELNGFPLLKCAARLLYLALGCLTGVPKSVEALAVFVLDPEAMPWMVWLRQRLWLLYLGGRANELPSRWQRDSFAQEWDTEWWVCNFAPWPARGSIGFKPKLLPLFQVGLGKLDQASLTQVRRGMLNGRGGKLALLLDVGSFEEKLESQYLAGRQDLANQRPKRAAKKLEQCLDSLNGAPLIAQAWWGPILKYWRAAALVDEAPGEAENLWRDLLNGPKGDEAGAQLALLALQRHAPGSAQELLAQIPDHFPSTVYAKALLLSRRGETAAAGLLLESFSERFAGSKSPYHEAAQRLLAALHERGGDETEARRQYQEMVSQSPGDAVSAARLGRLLVKTIYARGTGIESGNRPASAGPITLNDLMDGAVPKSAAGISWFHDYQLLWTLIEGCPNELDEARNEVLGQSNPGVWTQLLARRLLEEKRPGESLLVLQSASEFESGSDGGVPTDRWSQANRHTFLMLKAWNRLSGVWRTGPMAAETNSPRSLAGLLAEFARDLPSSADEGAKCASQWHFLLGEAIRLLSGECGGDIGFNLVRERWRVLPWPLFHLPDLWSPDETVRAEAATALASSLVPQDYTAEGPIHWDEEQGLLIEVLTSIILGREERQLDAYLILEPWLDSLPVDGPALWLKAAGAWFRKADWPQLIERELPECVADLSDPRVRLLVGLAYARAAVDDQQKDTRRAMLRLRQARTTLETFLGDEASAEIVKGHDWGAEPGKAGP